MIKLLNRYFKSNIKYLTSLTNRQFNSQKMKFFIFGILLFYFLWSNATSEIQAKHTNIINGNRSFVVDWENNRFLKDGKYFRFISGSFHYFRAHPKTWQRKLRTLRASGLNAVTTYVEWSLHNPKDGTYVWEGIADLVKFIKDAIAEDLLVILRPGPYICAERDLGGFPYWLLTKYPNIKLRTTDINYLYEVRIWYSELMRLITPYLYGNGGPIIMVQVENEYGSYYACDKKYRAWLRDETIMYVNDKAVLFTNDGPTLLNCGYIDGVLPTLDFGAMSSKELNNTWKMLRQYMPKGPLVNSEFYPGWLTHWGENIARVDTNSITDTFIEMLNQGASVNFYMFFGGTNFGFTAGANDGGPGHYQPDITSYDYDAPMDEAGDPTPKYYKLREIIGHYLELPATPIPKPTQKKNYGTLSLQMCCSILSASGRKALSTGLVIANKPKTFELLNQYSGLVLYETYMPALRRDPSILRVTGVHDRAYIYVNDDYVGTLSRETPIFELPISGTAGNVLQILVENQGRINYGDLSDFKGIVSDVLLDKKILNQWNMTKFPMESYQDIRSYMKSESKTQYSTYQQINLEQTLRSGPAIFYGNLDIYDNEIYDTYLDTSGWGKGIVFVNGENLGRYWPGVGPQITLYLPREVLKTGANEIIFIEYQHAPPNCAITFSDRPNLDGPGAYDN